MSWGVIIDGVNLDGVSVNYWMLRESGGAGFMQSSFIGADLRDFSFTNMIISGNTVTGATLTDADFIEVIVKYSDFTEVDATGADFSVLQIESQRH